MELPNRWEVKVEQEVISTATSCDSLHCAVAQSTKSELYEMFGCDRQRSRRDRVNVTSEAIWVHANACESLTSYECSQALSAWINQFDEDKSQCGPISIVFCDGKAWIQGEF